MSFLEYANMYEVVVYLDKKYERNESITVSNKLSKEEITQIVNDRFGEDGWYTYDIF